METQETVEAAEATLVKNPVESTGSKPKVQLSHIVRWILLLPVSFVGSGLVLKALLESFHYLIVTKDIIKLSPISIRISVLFSFFICGFCFIFLGTIVAPKYKKVSAYVMCGIPFIFLCIAFSWPVSKNLSNLCILVGGILAAAIFPIQSINKE